MVERREVPPESAEGGIPLRLGDGRISGALSIFLGASSLLAVLCFHFPEYLTTPELRANYDVEILRHVLRAGMLLAIGFGAITFFLWRAKRLGAIGIGLALTAQWLGGAGIAVDDFDQPIVSFGFDWLVLALLSNSLVFVLIERLWPLHPEQLVLRREWKLDLVYYAFNHVMISVVLLVTTFFSEQLFGWAVHAGVQSAIRSQPVWLQFAEVLFVADFTQYWVHRLFHESPRLWRIHAVHHCPAEMDWLSGSRMHFGEVLLMRSIVITPIFLLGFTENAINAYVIWVGIQAVLIHANVDLPFGPLRYLFVTPHFHHWHHSAEADAIDKNYASHLPVLDILFGTYAGNHVDAYDRWPERYGVVGKPLPESFLGQSLYPFVGRKDG